MSGQMCGAHTDCMYLLLNFTFLHLLQPHSACCNEHTWNRTSLVFLCLVIFFWVPLRMIFFRSCFVSKRRWLYLCSIHFVVCCRMKFSFWNNSNCVVVCSNSDSIRFNCQVKFYRRYQSMLVHLSTKTLNAYEHYRCKLNRHIFNIGMA